jgi:hypothetical protein
MNGNLIIQTLRRPVINAYICSENCSADETDVSNLVYKCTSVTIIIPCISTYAYQPAAMVEACSGHTYIRTEFVWSLKLSTKH